MPEPVTPEMVEKLHKEVEALRAHGHALEARLKAIEDHLHGLAVSAPSPKAVAAKSK